MSLIDALETIRNESDNEYFKGILTNVVADIEAGARFAEAMSKHSDAFSRMFVSMIEAGETSGSLEQVLAQMGEFFKRRHQLQRTIKQAMAYPKFVGGFFVIVLIGIFGFLVPQFQTIFEKNGAELPPLTVVLVAVSNAVRNWWFITFPVLTAGIIAFIMWLKTPGGRRKFDEKSLKAPLFGALISKSNTARFAMTLSVLLRNGVTLDQSLEITAKTMNNIILEEAIIEVRRTVIEGNSLYKAISDVNVFPNLMGKMVKVGEESGALPDMLVEVTSYYEDEVDTTVKKISAMVEPALIIALGGVVLVVVLGIYLPIFNLSKVAAGGGG